MLWLDLWSKAWVFRSLSPDKGWPAVSGVIEFRRSLNDGAVFGSFSGLAGMLIIASVFALGFVLYLFANSHRTQRSLQVALALILAGALGNLHDRAFIIADVARIQSPTGRQSSMIGLLVSDPSDPVVRIGDWPDGGRPRTFERYAVELRRQGVVRDFIKFVPRFPSWVPWFGGFDIWPWVFNVADASLVCGVGVLLLNCWLDRKPRHHSPGIEA
jgi:lipoprotein signal peptidase